MTIADLLRECCLKLDTEGYTWNGTLFVSGALLRELNFWIIMMGWPMIYFTENENHNSCTRNLLTHSQLYMQHWHNVIGYFGQPSDVLAWPDVTCPGVVINMRSDSIVCYRCALKHFSQLAYQYRAAIPANQLPGAYDNLQALGRHARPFTHQTYFINCECT